MELTVAATAPFGADVLERLAGSHDVKLLVTRADAPRGRGRHRAPPPPQAGAGDPGDAARAVRRTARASDGHGCRRGLWVADSRAAAVARALAQRPPVLA